MKSSTIKPAFQFKIGLQVGISLGDCLTRLHELETVVTHLHTTSDEIRCFVAVLKEHHQQQKDDSNENNRESRNQLSPKEDQMHKRQRSKSREDLTGTGF